MKTLPVLMLSLLLAGICAALSAEDFTFRTGARVRSELNEPVTANWRAIELRTVLEQISLDHELAIVLDRRIDPTAALPVDIVNQPLKEGLASLAEQFHGGCSVPGNVIYLGPADASRKLRTLIALRREELTAEESRIPADRQQLWLKPRTVSWLDLDSPREILDRLQSDLSFQITNPTLITHDLWAEAVLPQVTAVEALSVILIQFDLTFRWQSQGTEIELLPVPETVRVSRRHKPRGKPLEKVLAEWRLLWPDAEFQLSDREFVVLATVEEHDELSTGKRQRENPVAADQPVPLDRRQFTLKIKDVSARDLMAELEKTGARFEFNPQTLTDAGIDLDQFVALDVRKLTAQEFFHALFDPLRIRFTIDGLTVTLKPQ